MKRDLPTRFPKNWKLHTNYKKLQKKPDILNGIGEGLNEVLDARKTGRKLQTLKEFLETLISTF